jgi:predicted trehalose synthase
MLWSFGRVASVAAARRDPSGSENLGPLAHEWERRNRLAFMVGYQGVQGIAGLIPRAHDDVQRLAGLFELDRAAGRLARRRD